MSRKCAISICAGVAIIASVLLYANSVKRIESITFDTATGDKVKIEFFGSTGSLMVEGDSFSVYDGKLRKLEARFIDNDMFNDFKNTASDTDSVERLGLEVLMNEEDEIGYYTYIVAEANASSTPDVTLVKRLSDNTSIVCHSDSEFSDALYYYDNLDFEIE